MSGETVVALVRQRLSTTQLTERAQRFALAAVLGETALEQVLASPDAPEAAEKVSAEEDAAALQNVWLRSITVHGFRGVGPAVTLPLEPGPGLTLVLGRNGSGKSSFAEGVEAALTGSNERLTTKTVEWRKQWRNVHDGATAEVVVEFHVDGSNTPLTVRHTWNGKDIAAAVTTVEQPGVDARDLADLGWAEAMERFRPFLSYDDLGKVSGRPSVGFDLLAGVLGLDAITAAQSALTSARGGLEGIIAAPATSLVTILTDLRDVDDERARRASAALTSTPPDVQEVLSTLRDVHSGDGGTSLRTTLSRLSALLAPDIDVASERVKELTLASVAAGSVKGTDADDAARLADLLQAALAHHVDHGDESCPVCGQGSLDSTWHVNTLGEVARLRERAREVSTTNARLREALLRSRQLVLPVPAELTSSSHSIDTTDALAAWREWATLTEINDAEALATRIAQLLPPLADALETVRDATATRLRQMEDAWRPIAGRVQNWLDLHAAAEEAIPTYDDILSALNWIKAETERLRDERLAPFRAMSARIWGDLRQESNVDLGPIAFTGSGQTRRKLDVPVTIDGVVGGVPMLSNGELHALGLSLFLPRSTAPDSPFRFVLIDDPVQAMDPSKVDGLAKVLHDAASDRQVIVFTHDDRLAEALRRLMLPTTVLELVRRERSFVEVVPSIDPIRRYLDDARQLARTTRLPDDLAAVAVAGSCRDAVEAACQRVARQRLTAEGLTIAAIDERLRRAPTTNHRVALALLGDGRRTGQVMSTLNSLAGEPWAADVLRDVREGAHQPRPTLDRIIKDSDRLCDLILAQAP